jgi:RHS repeat-associated protein
LNGNMTNRDGDVITWFSHNRPKKINYGSTSSEFWYAADRSRYKHVAVSGGSTTTTRYFGPHFEVETRGSLTIYRHYVFAGGQAIAQHERRSSGSPLNDIQYLHRDHQASVVATTNVAGTVRQRFEYDAFGWRTRSFGSGADDTERGYTGHEHLDAVELTHMNGRVQDPELGRFISADPFVQAPYHSQSLNRYSYVWNNPLTFVDPSGFQTDWDVYPTPGPHCGKPGVHCVTPGPGGIAASSVIEVDDTYREAYIAAVLAQANVPAQPTYRANATVSPQQPPGFWYRYFNEGVVGFIASDVVGDLIAVANGAVFDDAYYNPVSGKTYNRADDIQRLGLQAVTMGLGGLTRLLGSLPARSAPNLLTGRGYDAGDMPVRIGGTWSVNDLKQGLLGHPPRGLGSPTLHHGGQMPGAALHEVLPKYHLNNSALHRNRWNQGVTDAMRLSDRQLHWWYRAREQGADQLLPRYIYD